MVKFRCKRSGNSIAFSDPNDIESMRKHEGYDEIKDGMQEEIKAPITTEKEVKRRGRPRKV